MSLHVCEFVRSCALARSHAHAPTMATTCPCHAYCGACIRTVRLSSRALALACSAKTEIGNHGGCRARDRLHPLICDETLAHEWAFAGRREHPSPSLRLSARDAKIAAVSKPPCLGGRLSLETFRGSTREWRSRRDQTRAHDVRVVMYSAHAGHASKSLPA
eukprot:5480786-Pleurochrysis_carterae.AAC.1